jgi:hypothetical protein
MELNMERDVILKINDYEKDRNLLVKTSFSIDDLDLAIDTIRDKYDDPQDTEKLLLDLEKNGYIKSVGLAPEILEINEW